MTGCDSNRVRFNNTLESMLLSIFVWPFADRSFWRRVAHLLVDTWRMAGVLGTAQVLRRHAGNFSSRWSEAVRACLAMHPRVDTRRLVVTSSPVSRPRILARPGIHVATCAGSFDARQDGRRVYGVQGRLPDVLPQLA